MPKTWNEAFAPRLMDWFVGCLVIAGWLEAATMVANRIAEDLINERSHVLPARVSIMAVFIKRGQVREAVVIELYT